MTYNLQLVKLICDLENFIDNVSSVMQERSDIYANLRFAEHAWKS